MSYEEFKKRIDTARQILVGAVPSPAGQIDQITYALIYKFMNDIDDKSASLPGGKRKYFTGEYEKYNWHKLMEPGLGAHDQLELYRQAIQNMSKNDNLPVLFQSIYQNAFLPFNSPTVLNLFLKEIDKFSHSESDDIGDAYEYLLSITGAQGDVGQFRTPRHIIKFIVEAVNPTKSDSVLDPAVGTAGFLIAAYNHVKKHHDGVEELSGLPDENEIQLSSDELDWLNKNYRGYDIDPTMVRTAAVNLYLHGFRTPDIRNHDTLSEDEYWDKKYDVILANPPFMSPKGGIQPHRKFSIQANRAEVLFVDYIASHLKPNGRAGIVVPEGIIFQSGKAYKELRKNLVENSLIAVVSLPAGVFNPYSGVKTSVLLLDKVLAKQKDGILFIDIKNTGITLDAKQSKKPGGQLPEALKIIESFKEGLDIKSPLAHVTEKNKIAENAEYNLSGARYIATDIRSNSVFPNVELGELIIESREKAKNLPLQVWSVSNKHGFINPATHFSKQIASDDTSNYKIIKKDYFAYNPSRINVGSLALNANEEIGCVSPMYVVFSVDQDKLLPSYLLRLLETDVFNQFVKDMAQGAVRTQLKFADLAKFQIPLPSIEVQHEIVAELDSYQTIIDAANTVVKTYKPTIKVSQEWEKVRLDDITDKLTDGSHSSPQSIENGKPYVTVKDVRDGVIDINNSLKISQEDFDKLVKNGCKPDRGDVLFSKDGTVGRVALVRSDDDFVVLSSLAIIKPKKQKVDPSYLALVLQDPHITAAALGMMKGIAIRRVILKDLKELKIPLPSIEVQHEIVRELEAEQKLIESSKKLIDIYKTRIKSKISEVWGE